MFLAVFGQKLERTPKLRRQNLDRITVVDGYAPCLTPFRRLWLRRRPRWLLAEEALILQGTDAEMHADEISVSPEALKRRLAGKEFCSILRSQTYTLNPKHPLLNCRVEAKP